MRKWINVCEEAGRMVLGDMITVSTKNKDADFWIVRRGSRESVGSPTREYNPEHFGIKVTSDKLDPSYLFYMMQYLHSKKIWEGVATGSLKLVNIRKEDVLNIPIS